MTKSEQDGEHPSSHYLVVEDSEHPSTWHLRVRDADGSVNHRLMGAAWAALHGGYRGNKYEGPGKQAALAKLKALYKSEGLELPGEGTGNREQGTEGRVAVLLNGPGQVVSSGLHEIPIALSGTWVKEGRKFSITHDDLRAMVRNFQKGKGQVVIDFEHASEQPEVAKGGPIPAAGWIRRLSANGILRATVEWTPQAKEMIAAGQYRFFSPAIDWNYQDKQTGEPQGATLTSGALTNHPFLEELPPIMLGDFGFPIGAVLEPPLRDRNGGKMKRLTMKKLTSGDAKGHHGIFDGDDMMGYVHADDFKDHAKKHLDDLMDYDDFEDAARDHLGVNPDAKAKGEKTAEDMSELGVTTFDEARRLVEAGRAAETAGAAERARSVLLSEAVKDGNLDNGKAAILARENKITLADYIAANEAAKAIDTAVAAGKILPRDRAFFFRDALERPTEFAEYVKNAVPVVRLGTQGIGSAEQMPVDQEVDLGVKKLMSSPAHGGIDYGKAMKLLFKDNPGLEKRYREAHQDQPRTAGSPA